AKTFSEADKKQQRTDAPRDPKHGQEGSQLVRPHGAKHLPEAVSKSPHTQATDCAPPKFLASTIAPRRYVTIAVDRNGRAAFERIARELNRDIAFALRIRCHRGNLRRGCPEISDKERNREKFVTHFPETGTAVKF
ncbi:MAG TPA: hypothetical protein VG897_05390, partial [Terriglobales bacterium]|nr:hypothetical protein [Terriglobales bacterium]